MATLAVQTIVDVGTATVLGSVTASDRADVGNGINTFLRYKSSSGSVTHVTIVGAGLTDYNVAYPSNVVAIPANGEVVVPIHKSQDQGDGLGALITTSDNASLTCALVRR